jgi:hypothetical protein
LSSWFWALLKCFCVSFIAAIMGRGEKKTGKPIKPRKPEKK